MLANFFLKEHLLFRIDTGQFLFAELEIGIGETLNESTLWVIGFHTALCEVDALLRVGNTRVAQRYHLIVRVDLLIVFIDDVMILDGRWLGLGPDGFLLCIDASFEEVVVRE